MKQKFCIGGEGKSENKRGEWEELISIEQIGRNPVLLLELDSYGSSAIQILNSFLLHLFNHLIQ